ncbi:MAG TPA: ABC transporter permease [Lachnospiraceae bacterium]
MAEIIAYFSENSQDYLRLVGEHIKISFLSVFVAMVIGVTVGIFCSKQKRLKWIFEQLFGILRIVPSLAILIICIPIMGTGLKPAMVALTVLAIPPILINTAQGFIGVSPAIREAAKAMGMSRLRIFFTVKLPLAFPMIFAGIRTATVEIIASATLASYIGAGGLGELIFTGLGLLRADLLYIGGISVAILSLGIGAIMDMIYRRLTRYQNV